MTDTGAHEMPHGPGVPKVPAPDAKPSVPPPSTISRADLEAMIKKEVDNRLREPPKTADSSRDKATGNKSAEYTPIKDREGVEVKPFDTTTAVGKTLDELTKDWLHEDVGKGWGHAVLPFTIGAVTEVSRGHGGWMKTMFDVVFASPVGTVAKDVGANLGNVVGLGTEAAAAAATFAAASGTAALLTGIVSPSVSLVKRVALGANAWSEMAKFWINKDEGGLINRFVRGGESWAMRKLFFHEDKQMRKLLKWEAEGKDPSQIMVGKGKKELANMVASAATAKTGAALLEQMGVEFSPDEKIKVQRFERAFNYAMRVYDAKVTDPNEREIFANDTLKKMVHDKELKLWLKQTGLMTGIGVLKSATMIGLLQMLEANVLERAFNAASGVAGAVWQKGTELTAFASGQVDKFLVWAQTQLTGVAPVAGVVPAAPVAVPPVQPNPAFGH